MNICICGSRKFKHLDKVRAQVQVLAMNVPNLTIIVGGALGVDQAAEDEARELGVEVKVFPALWGTYGKRAGAIRNRQMVEAADQVYAFWDGQSAGTKITMDMTIQMKKPLHVILVDQYGNQVAQRV